MTHEGYTILLRQSYSDPQTLHLTLNPTTRRVTVLRQHGPAFCFKDTWATDDRVDDLLSAVEALTTQLRTIVQDLDHRTPA